MEILDRACDAFWVILEEAQGCIALVAEEATDSSSDMVMINAEVIRVFS
jgi:hypothetical protein